MQPRQRTAPKTHSGSSPHGSHCPKTERRILLPADKAACLSFGKSLPAGVALAGCCNAITIQSEFDISQYEENVNVMGEEIKLCTTAHTLPSTHQECGIIGLGITMHIKKNFHYNKLIRIHNKCYLFVYAEL